ncbi:protein of unknown function, partial [Pseudomonas inefficax]
MPCRAGLPVPAISATCSARRSVQHRANTVVLSVRDIGAALRPFAGTPAPTVTAALPILVGAGVPAKGCK